MQRERVIMEETGNVKQRDIYTKGERDTERKREE